MAGVSFKRSNRHPHYPGLGGTFRLLTERSRTSYCRQRATGRAFAGCGKNLRFWAGNRPQWATGEMQKLS